MEIVRYQLSQVVASQNKVYVTYQENPQNGGRYHVFFRNSLDNGEAFGKILQLDNPDHEGSNPLLAASGNNVYVSWTDQKDYASPSQVLFARSTDGGNTFSSPAVLSNNTENSGIQQIFASGNNVYVLMIDELKGNTILRLSFRASHDNGITFGSPIVLLEYTMTRGSIIMSLSEDGKTIYAVGEESKNCPIDSMNCNYDIFLKKSTDYGTSFGDFAELDKTRIVHVPAVLQFDARYLGDENHNPSSSVAYSDLYLYAVPLAPSQYDATVLPQEVNVTKSFGIAQIQVSVKPTFKDSEVSHMKLYLDRLPCGMENYDIKQISDNDTASLTHPAIFNFTMYPGAYTPPGKYFIFISQNPSSLGESDLDVGGFILNVLAGN